jgi:hypothetical protein
MAAVVIETDPLRGLKNTVFNCMKIFSFATRFRYTDSGVKGRAGSLRNSHGTDWQTRSQRVEEWGPRRLGVGGLRNVVSYETETVVTTQKVNYRHYAR